MIQARVINVSPENTPSYNHTGQEYAEYAEYMALYSNECVVCQHLFLVIFDVKKDSTLHYNLVASLWADGLIVSLITNGFLLCC